MTLTKTELIDVVFLEPERAYANHEKRRLEKLGFICQGEDKSPGRVHLQFLRIADITPSKMNKLINRIVRRKHKHSFDMIISSHYLTFNYRNVICKCTCGDYITIQMLHDHVWPLKTQSSL